MSSSWRKIPVSINSADTIGMPNLIGPEHNFSSPSQDTIMMLSPFLLGIALRNWNEIHNKFYIVTLIESKDCMNKS